MSGLEIGLIGHSGRLGRAVHEAALKRGWHVCLLRDSGSTRSTGTPRVLFECARAEATFQTLETAIALRIPVVFATSGRGPIEENAMREAAACVPVMLATNLSPGHALQMSLVRLLASQAATPLDRVVVDRHSAAKRDAPSATAQRLAQACAARIEVLRHGQAVADHHVIFDWLGETIEIVHRVSSLQPAALGALEAIERAARITTAGVYDLMGEPLDFGP